MKKFIAYLTAAAIIFDLFTPLRLFFEGGRALMMLLPTLLIIVYDRLFLKKSFLLMALYVGAALFVMLMGSSYFSVPFLLQVVYAYACFEHFMVTRDNDYARIVITALYATLVALVVTSLPLFIAIPNLSRIMLDAEKNGVTTSLFYWTLSYQAIHSLPVYSIPIFYLAKNSNKKLIRLAAFLFTCAIFVLMLFADSTGALLVNVAIFGILLLYNQKKSLKANFARLAALGAGMLIFLNKTILIGLLTAVQPVFTGSSTYKKIDEIANIIQGGEAEGDIEGREEKLDITLRSFVENPFFPTIEKESYEKIGGHNFLFDQIVALGLLLGIFFIVFLIERIKRPLKSLTFTTKPYYWVGVMALLVIGVMKNFFLLFPACCILPMFMIWIENNGLIMKISKR